ncbi:hypothetical protein PRZ48_000758 [Zasmidium cellare]|uniref:Uncharacterized protein n=1 Tax=Zasmidium cellare TaxID=395010 RepID=A0ABR0EZC4_ZASCE|nr:hypothetical protein PRZ48_000758 [Zasmidium cellare]
MPPKRMRVKREHRPVEEDDFDELGQTHASSSSTTTMPVRAASVMSNAGPSNGDVEMADCSNANGAHNNTNHVDGTNNTHNVNGVHVNGAHVNGAQGPSNVNGIHGSNTNTGMQALGNDSRQLIQAIQTLESLNIDATLSSLPKFVVIGDQSAGKSSIIEAVSDITLPRSTGTCTRCPFKITTTSAKDGENWMCKVSLHVKYAYTASTRPGDGPFTGWAEQKDMTILEFATVFDKHELEITLRRAQLAILNPHKNFAQFVNCPITSDSSNEQRVLFSPNIISLDISAPLLPDLSFYDLPGAINTMGDESKQHFVQFIEDLIMSYIQDEKTLILLACAANQDLETSTAFRYLINCRAKDRTVGVLTKPDLMEPNRVDFVNSLLARKTYLLGGGWFVTRQLSQSQLDQRLTYERARRIESDFFSQEMWTRQLAAYTGRFGVPNLQAALSEKLVQHILQDLPEIVERVQARLSYVNDQLAMFPEQVTAPSLSVIMEIDKVKGELVQQLNADSLRSKMRKPYRDVFRSLLKKLQELKPQVIWTTPGYSKPSVTIEDSEEEVTPSKNKRLNNGSRAISVVTPQSNRSRRTPAASSSNSSQGPDGFARAVFRLNDVKVKFDSAPGADLPAQTSEAVVRDLIGETVGSWAPVTDSALKKLKQVFISMLNKTIPTALAQRQGTELFNEVDRITHELFEELFQNTEATVHKLVAGETHRPMTYDSDTLKQKKDFYKTEHRKLRQEQRVAEWAEQLEAETNKVINLPDQKKKAADPSWMAVNLGPDEYDREVEALATPAAYYEIASAAMVDSIAKQFEIGLMQAYESRIHRKLLEELQTADQAHCAQLLAEDPERERQRADFVAELSKLEQALAELSSLPATQLPN